MCTVTVHGVKADPVNLQAYLNMYQRTSRQQQTRAATSSAHAQRLQYTVLRANVKANEAHIQAQVSNIFLFT